MAIETKHVITSWDDLQVVVEAEAQEGWQSIQVNKVIQFDDTATHSDELVVFFGRQVGWQPAATTENTELFQQEALTTPEDTTSLLDKELAAKGGKNGKETAI